MPSSTSTPVVTAVADAAIRSSLWVRTIAERIRELGDGAERGEGVISAAIAVLIMAFLGAAAWLAFKGIFDSASSKAESQVDQIGG